DDRRIPRALEQREASHAREASTGHQVRGAGSRRVHQLRSPFLPSGRTVAGVLWRRREALRPLRRGASDQRPPARTQGLRPQQGNGPLSDRPPAAGRPGAKAGQGPNRGVRRPGGGGRGLRQAPSLKCRVPIGADGRPAPEATSTEAPGDARPDGRAIAPPAVGGGTSGRGDVDPEVEAPTMPRADGLAAKLRGFGPIGILAALVITAAGPVLEPLGALLTLGWAHLSRTPWREL